MGEPDLKKKKSKLVPILITILVILVLVNAGVLGFVWYRNNHIFVENKAYSIHATELDLREEDISFEHYDSVHAQLPDCRILWNVPFQGNRFSNDSTALSINQLNRADIELMKTYFPALKKVDAAGCQDYEALEELKAQLPEVEVTYSVSLGNAAFSPDSDVLSLNPGDYTAEALKTNLPYLHHVTSILLHTPDMTLEEIDALREAFPDIDIASTVEIMGQEFTADTTQLDLSAMAEDQVNAVCAKLPMLPALEAVELMDSQGNCSLSRDAVKALMAAAPNAAFNYVFDFYGQTISADTEEVYLKNVKIGDDNVEEVRFALDMVQNCKRFVLENCGLSNELLAQLRDEYRDKTKVVWRIYFGNGTSMTDADVIRSVYDLVDDNCHDLVYCEDARYLDIGHDEYLDELPFIEGMVSLEYVIISGSPIKSLEPFTNCKNLKVLEASNCEKLTDISPLAACENLEMLNISYTHVTDLSPLDNLNLTHLVAKYNPSRIPAEEQARFKEVHPDCWTEFVGTQPYGRGWRYDENDNKMDWYKDIAAAFRYPKAPNNVGWYLDK